MYCIAMHLALRECEPAAYIVVQAAIERPGPETVRAVLAAGVGHRWRERIEHALIELGVEATAGMECPK